MAPPDCSRLVPLADQIRALSPPDKLRLAAALLEKQRPDLAHRIAEDVVLELGAALALRALERRTESR